MLSEILNADHLRSEDFFSLSFEKMLVNREFRQYMYENHPECPLENPSHLRYVSLLLLQVKNNLDDLSPTSAEFAGDYIKYTSIIKSITSDLVESAKKYDSKYDYILRSSKRTLDASISAQGKVHNLPAKMEDLIKSKAKFLREEGAVLQRVLTELIKNLGILQQILSDLQQS
ncbi:MAG: hypothetical protein IT269_14505 [Saprospiraceae bacterium]|nr:hypothetical protein [Saprospiraceae bacterium]